jgi:hypothetical protein
MKIILSRKGFDKGSGGCPSPQDAFETTASAGSEEWSIRARILTFPPDNQSLTMQKV